MTTTMNTFLTPKIVGLEALRILRPQLAMMKQVNVDYSAEFVNVGDTISVRRPTSFSVSDMLNADGSYNSTNVQAVKEGSVPVRINKWKDVSFALNAKDKTLILPVFSDRVIAPAVTKLVTAVESDLLALFKDIPTYYGTPGTTPQSLQDYAGIKNQLFQQLVPFTDRKVALFLDGTATMNLQPLLTVLSGGAAAKQMENEDLNNDQLAADLYGMKPFSSQLITAFTPGTIAQGASPTAAATTILPDLASGTQYISIACGKANGTLNHGDILSIDGCMGSYVVLGTNAGGSEGTRRTIPAPFPPCRSIRTSRWPAAYRAHRGRRHRAGRAHAEPGLPPRRLHAGHPQPGHAGKHQGGDRHRRRHRPVPARVLRLGRELPAGCLQHRHPLRRRHARPTPGRALPWLERRGFRIQDSGFRIQDSGFRTQIFWDWTLCLGRTSRTGQTGRTGRTLADYKPALR